jgi:hypothetical protein
VTRDSVHLAARRGRLSRVICMTRPDNAERCCPSHSPTLRPWITSYVEGLWSPKPRRPFGKEQAKADAPFPALLQR